MHKYKYQSPPLLKRPPKELFCPKQFRKLRDRCLASIRSFHSEGEVVHTPDGNYVFQDNGSNILAVAHLDTVQPEPRHFGCTKGKADIIYNAQLDDRLGAWIALDVLPSLGVKVDVLLTEGEESCRSTAAYFEAKKDYNWLIEFDREGDDVVMYDYETYELVSILENHGNTVGEGTFSDISVMEYLGVAAFNWGIGSYHNHWPDSYFSISQCKAAIARFVEFYNVQKDTQLPHIPSWDEKFDWDRDADKWWNKEEEESWVWTEKHGWQKDEAKESEYDRLWREEKEFEQWQQDHYGTTNEHQQEHQSCSLTD